MNFERPAKVFLEVAASKLGSVIQLDGRFSRVVSL